MTNGILVLLPREVSSLLLMTYDSSQFVEEQPRTELVFAGVHVYNGRPYENVPFRSGSTYVGTKIVLKKDIDTLGKAGALVEVAPGYARNYLIPQGLAVKATAGIIKQAEQRLAKQREIAAEQRQEALLVKKTLEDHGHYVVYAQVGENDQLFGTITNQDVAEVIATQTGTTVDRREITIEGDVKTTGVYTAKVRIYSDVIAIIRLQVTPAG